MIHFYRSTQAGIPQLQRGVQNQLITMLDTVLCVGFNSRCIDSIVRVGEIATANISVGHEYVDRDIVLISGAEQSEYNIEVPIFDCTTSTFKFRISETASALATGAITCKIAPAGWTKVDESANYGVFRCPGGQQHTLYVNEETCTELEAYSEYGYSAGGCAYETAKISVVEECSDVNTFARKTPSAYLRKAYVTNDTSITSKWFMVASERSLILGIGFYNYSSYGYDLHYFGEFKSFSPTDVFNCLVGGPYAYYDNIYFLASGVPPRWSSLSAWDDYNKGNYIYAATIAPATEQAGLYLLRNYKGEEISASFRFTTCLGITSSTKIGAPSGDISFLNPVDGTAILNSIFIKESGTVRGKLSGIYAPIGHPTNNLVENLQVMTTLMLDGTYRDVLFAATYTGFVAIDLTGPWYD